MGIICNKFPLKPIQAFSVIWGGLHDLGSNEPNWCEPNQSTCRQCLLLTKKSKPNQSKPNQIEPNQSDWNFLKSPRAPWSYFCFKPNFCTQCVWYNFLIRPSPCNQTISATWNPLKKNQHMNTMYTLPESPSDMIEIIDVLPWRTIVHFQHTGQ